MKVCVQIILAFFGYVKVPLTAVQLSMAQEAHFERVYNSIPDEYPKQKEMALKLFTGQRVLTQFLRSGRMVQ